MYSRSGRVGGGLTVHDIGRRVGVVDDVIGSDIIVVLLLLLI